MTLQITGRIIMQATVCEKCGTGISLWNHKDVIRCDDCGAIYILLQNEFIEEGVLFEFNFAHFECMYNEAGKGSCANSCPAPHMYCEDHVSDECFEEIQKSISFCTNRLQEVNNKLEQMEESKKIWLIQKVSGIE